MTHLIISHVITLTSDQAEDNRPMDLVMLTASLRRTDMQYVFITFYLQKKSERKTER